MPRSSNGRFFVYTAIFGKYDRLLPVPRCTCATQFICFTDDAGVDPRGWTMVLDHSNYNDDPARKNRYYKMLAHQHFGEFDASLYIDGRVEMRRCPCELFDRYVGKAAFVVPYHQDRDCAYEEAEYCIRDGLADRESVTKQMSSYRQAGFPTHTGLTENGVLLRRHNDARVIEAMEMWWTEYSTASRRDQFSLAYVLWRAGIKPVELAEGPRLSGKYFVLRPHNTQSLSPIKRWMWHVTTSRHRNFAFGFLARLFELMAAVKKLR